MLLAMSKATAKLFKSLEIIMRILAAVLLIGLASAAWAENHKFEKMTSQIIFSKTGPSSTNEAHIGSSVNLYFDDIALLSVYLEFNTNEYGSLGY
jgi:hypothetical protein